MGLTIYTANKLCSGPVPRAGILQWEDQCYGRGFQYNS
jgi:hypothetical protein